MVLMQMGGEGVGGGGLGWGGAYIGTGNYKLVVFFLVVPAAGGPGKKSVFRGAKGGGRGGGLGGGGGALGFSAFPFPPPRKTKKGGVSGGGKGGGWGVRACRRGRRLPTCDARPEPTFRETMTQYGPGTEAQKCHIEETAWRVEPILAIESFQLGVVGSGGRVGRDAFGRNGMDVGGGDRRPRQQRLAHHAVVAERVVVRHEALVAPEPVRSRPGEIARRAHGQKLHRAVAASSRRTGRRQSGLAWRAPRRQPVRDTPGEGFRAIAQDFGSSISGRPVMRSPSPNGGDRGGVVARAEDRRAGDDDVGAGLDRSAGMLAILAAVDFNEGIEAARLAELPQTADLGQHLGQELTGRRSRD